MHFSFRRLLPSLIVFGPVLFAAADWPQFRGPHSAGVSTEKGLPTTWSESSGIQWKTSLPGFGASSPIVLKDRIYVTAYSGYGLDQDQPGEPGKLVREVVSLDANSGKELWKASFNSKGSEEPYQGFQALHGFASGTPSTDGKAIYAFFGRDGVVAVSLEGKALWQTSVGTKTHGWGSATSPALFENLVIVNASVESGSLVALDKNSGSEVWRAPGIDMSWSTPVLVAAGSATEVVLSSKGKITGFDPKTGKELWNCAGIPDYICPTVVAADGVVYAIGGRKNMAVAIKAGGRGDVTDTHKLWEAKAGSNVSSPVLFGGHLYWVSESKGIAYCVDAKSGQVVYEERMDPRPDRIYASPTIADGKIYVVSRESGAYVLAAEPKYQLLAHNKPLDSSIYNASPVPLGDGKLLLRSDKFLYCLGASN